MDDNTPYRTTRFTRNKTEDISNMLYAKIPPQAREVEEAVLGAILIEKEAFPIAAKILDMECFYVDAHAAIWNAMVTLFIGNSPIDLLTVMEELRKQGKLEEVGGPYYLSELSNKIASSANIDYHSRIIFQKYMQREMIRISNDVIRESYDDMTDPFDLLASAEQRFSQITEKIKNDTVRKSYEIAIETIVAMKNAQANPKDLVGIPTPLEKLDQLTEGWQEPDLIIIAAGTAEGKTTFMLQCAEHSAMKGFPTAIFELEMSATQMCWKLFAPIIGKTVSDIKKGNLTEEEWSKLDEYIDRIQKNDNLYISDKGGVDIVDLKTTIRSLVLDQGVKLILIDYIQLIHSKKGIKHFNREAEISFVSKELKALAKELKVPIIALAQIKRLQGEKGRFYVMSDLRESAAIEMDADMIIFLWRPFYHGVKEAKDTGIPYSFDDTEVIIAKQRLGEPGKILSKFDGKRSQFKDYDFIAYQEPTKEEKNKMNFQKSLLDNGSSGGVSVEEPIDEDLPF